MREGKKCAPATVTERTSNVTVKKDKGKSKLLQLQHRRRQRLSSCRTASGGPTMVLPLLLVEKNTRICEEFISGVSRNRRLLLEFAFYWAGT
jgi:hypothetical protein